MKWKTLQGNESIVSAQWHRLIVDLMHRNVRALRAQWCFGYSIFGTHDNSDAIHTSLKMQLRKTNYPQQCISGKWSHPAHVPAHSPVFPLRMGSWLSHLIRLTSIFNELRFLPGIKIIFEIYKTQIENWGFGFVMTQIFLVDRKFSHGVRKDEFHPLNSSSLTQAGFSWPLELAVLAF